MQPVNLRQVHYIPDGGATSTFRSNSIHYSANNGQLVSPCMMIRSYVKDGQRQPACPLTFVSVLYLTLNGRLIVAVKSIIRSLASANDSCYIVRSESQSIVLIARNDSPPHSTPAGTL